MSALRPRSTPSRASPPAGKANRDRRPPTIQADRAMTALTDACRYCLRRKHLRKTTTIALVVGLLLTAINQGDVILSGHSTPATAVRCTLNFLIPFIVSNLGLLSGRAPHTTDRDRQ
jgi:hypothetical protein